MDPARARGALLMVGAMALFAVMAICTRLAAREMSAAQLTLLRFALTAAGVLALVLAGRAAVRPRNPRLLALRGVAGGMAVLLYFHALAHCRSAGVATLLNFMSPIFTNLFAWLALGERPTPRLLVGVVLAFAGVVLVLDPRGAIEPGWGELAGLVSAVFSGLAVTAIRAARSYDDAPTILFSFCVAGLVLSAPFALADWRAAGATAWGWALAMGLTSLCAQLMMTHAYGLVTATEGALYHQLTPVFTFTLGALLLAEAWSATAVLGTLVTLGAVGYAAGALRLPWSGAPRLP